MLAFIITQGRSPHQGPVRAERQVGAHQPPGPSKPCTKANSDLNSLVFVMGSW